MTTTTCPHCHKKLAINEEDIGQEIQCPCGKVFAAKKIVRRPVAVINEEPEFTKTNKFTCWMLGFLLSIIGVIIAQATDGSKGASYAARGAVINLALGAGLYLVLSTL